MYSGGIDSTGVLHQLLTDEMYKNIKLIVHHIHIVNRENRARAEAQAVSSILKYYKDNKDNLFSSFLYTESIFNTTGFAPLGSNRFPFDMDVCAFYAGNICAAREDINYVAMGRTKTDLEGTDQSFSLRMDRAQKIFKSVLSLEKRDSLPEYIFPMVSYSKKQIWNLLPKQVRGNTWWCRRPVYLEDRTIPCGKCETCQTVKGFVKQEPEF
jgi:7-cyano-7-deazaguanine synthase in queuosine biosynthesis